MRLDYVHLFNTRLCYAPISVSFCVNLPCLISNFVSVMVLLLGFNFHTNMQKIINYKVTIHVHSVVSMCIPTIVLVWIRIPNYGTRTTNKMRLLPHKGNLICLYIKQSKCKLQSYKPLSFARGSHRTTHGTLSTSIFTIQSTS